MTAALNIYDYMTIKADGELHVIGSLDRPSGIVSCVGQVIRRKIEVAISTTKTIFDVSNDLSSFEVIGISCDFDLMIELGTDISNSIGDEYYTIGHRGSGRAGEFGAMFRLLRDDSYAGYTANFAGGTLDLIEKIRVKNLSTTQAAQVEIFGVR